MASNKETAARIVERMLETIGKGEPLPWTKPWSTGSRPSVQVLDGYTTLRIPVTHWSRQGRPYNGINPMLLSMCKKQGEMITFAQCKAEGGHIRKGAKAATVIYWNMIRKEIVEQDENGNDVKRIHTIPMLKTFNVFSVEQDTDLKTKHNPEPQEIVFPRYHYEPIPGLDTSAYDPGAEAIIAGYLDRNKTFRLERESNTDSAYYQPAFDKVVCPNITQFSGAGEFYSTLFHELGHSTGHVSRLNRFTGEDTIAAFGDAAYSREELVAEITSASILSMLGLEDGNTFRNSTAYVDGWSSKLRDDPMLFISAANKAEKAIACILTGELPATTH